MYYEYFGFSAPPFSIAPDPRYLYLSPRHNEALAHLLYGLQSQSGGFVLLTGEVGAGKTTVCRCVLEQAPADCDVALIYNPKLGIEELLSTLCDELHIRYPSGTKGTKAFVDRLNARLLESHAKGRKTVLIVDEAQNLDDEVLEQLRLLTNLETSERKLLQIVLLGQPELIERLARPEMRQLTQRIVARYHLANLLPNEVANYIHHRLTVAGVRRNLFPMPTVRRIVRHTRGNPRLINVLCDRALLGAYTQGLDTVDPATLDRAAEEVLGRHAIGGGWRQWLPDWNVALFGGALIALGALVFLFASHLYWQASADASVAAVPPGASTAPRTMVNRMAKE